MAIQYENTALNTETLDYQTETSQSSGVFPCSSASASYPHSASLLDSPRRRSLASAQLPALASLSIFENGYPEVFVKSGSKPHSAAAEPAEEPRAKAFISYVAGLSEDVRRVSDDTTSGLSSNRHPPFAGS